MARVQTACADDEEREEKGSARRAVRHSPSHLNDRAPDDRGRKAWRWQIRRGRGTTNACRPGRGGPARSEQARSTPVEALARPSSDSGLHTSADIRALCADGGPHGPPHRGRVLTRSDETDSAQIPEPWSSYPQAQDTPGPPGSTGTPSAVPGEPNAQTLGEVMNRRVQVAGGCAIVVVTAACSAGITGIGSSSSGAGGANSGPASSVAQGLGTVVQLPGSNLTIGVKTVSASVAGLSVTGNTFSTSETATDLVVSTPLSALSGSAEELLTSYLGATATATSNPDQEAHEPHVVERDVQSRHERDEERRPQVQNLANDGGHCGLPNLGPLHLERALDRLRSGAEDLHGRRRHVQERGRRLLGRPRHRTWGQYERSRGRGHASWTSTLECQCLRERAF